MAKLYFVTGTDTGVGKTVVTALLLAHLRATGQRALATKPFCSGGTGDADILHALQAEDLHKSEVNPFYFPEPLAPLIAARQAHTSVSADAVARHIRNLAARCDILLIEGAGGLLAPIGEPNFSNAIASPAGTYNLLHLVQELTGNVILVALNKLGVVNHTLLTLAALKDSQSQRKILRKSVALVSPPGVDISAASNPGLMRELISPLVLCEIPWLANSSSAIELVAAAKKFGKELETLL